MCDVDVIISLCPNPGTNLANLCHHKSPKISLVMEWTFPYLWFHYTVFQHIKSYVYSHFVIQDKAKYVFRLLFPIKLYVWYNYPKLRKFLHENL